MKQLLVLLLIGIWALAGISNASAQEGNPPIPLAPTDGSIVLDQLDWLTPAQEMELNAINQKLDEEGIAQIAVVTLDNCGVDKQKFRNELFRAWGIGHSDDNDGLLILVCWYGGDEARRSVEQETGYGLEAVLPDVLTARVAREEFVPAFQANRPGDGLMAMVRRYNALLHGETYTPPSASPSATLALPADASGKPSQESFSPFDLILAFALAGAIGFLPGFLWTSIANRLRPAKRRGKNTKGKRKFAFPRFEKIAVAEVIILIPVLAFLYKMIDSDVMLILFLVLLAWFVILALYVFRRPLARLSSDRDIERAREIRRNVNRFGGGSSGGGGSSTKFLIF